MADVNNDKVYIRVNKGLCKQMESKFEGRKYYNIMMLPENTIVGDTNLSFGIINPHVMIEDKRNPNMMCAIYDTSKMKSQDVSILLKPTSGDRNTSVKIDVRALRDAVAKANHIYYENHKKGAVKEMQQKKEQLHEAGQARMKPLTTDKLRQQNDMSY